MALYHFTATVFSRSGRNTVQAIAYRAGCKLTDPQTGETFDYSNKTVEHVELVLPKDAPQWALDIQNLIQVDRQKGVQAFVDVVESAEQRMNSQVWREFEFALHRELTNEQNMALAREFVQNQICSRGMAAQLNFHFDRDEKTGEEKPHCHMNVTTRRLSEKGMGAKEREWNKKELLRDLRVQWQEYSNFHLKLNGHDIQVDHRSHKERGIELEPQPKMGRGVLEQEKRLQKLEGGDGSPIMDKVKDFHDVQLRNLYRIMRRPEAVLEMASKNHATFMWADVQKILHRYVDELPLFQKLEAKLKNSNELMVLRSEGIELEEKAIYTTRTMLTLEKNLVENAETLDKSKTHGAKEYSILQSIAKADEVLKDHGGLSQDQKRAIYHMADEGQIKCVVGIAGAGKTTALEVCHHIWKTEGYTVYGLAPTGKAADNLEQSSDLGLTPNGIPSTTLHKFLKNYEEGRCQYNSNSVLVLDEAGMVDMERFEQLLGAVKKLGVKLIVVGDGAQLQPVEAGPAFRLVTTRLGKVELTTVLRQKEEWQRESTVLFGKQDTQAAIEKYVEKGYVHIIEEKLPSLHEAIIRGDREGVLKLYEVSSRTSSLIYREMARDAKKENPQGNPYGLVKQHQDFECYLEWKDLQKSAAAQILKEGESYHSLLEAHSLDPTKMAMLFVDKKQDKSAQHEEVISLLKQHGLDSLIGLEKQRRQGIDVRQGAKEALIRAWHEGFQSTPEKNSLMLAFSNRDVNDLNRTARALLKDSGHISRDEFTYTVARIVENDFGDQRIIRSKKHFSKGDRIVFTHNDDRLGVKNGGMGTIMGINRQTMQVKLDEGKEISFAPNLNPYFDQGWAITIHKSQGTTVDQTYLLASFEMTQNLAYVAMTRHRYGIKVFGSSLDFWRPEKLPEALSKSGEKLSAGDYLDAESLNKLMQQDDRLLTKIFERVSNELEAMGAVSKRAFWQVADHFFGIKREKEIRVSSEFAQSSIREEIRAEELLQVKANDSAPQSIATYQAKNTKPFIEASFVEAALKQNLSAFADDIFSSIGEPYNAAASSAIERRYGKKGHIAVNLKTGAWMNHKDSDRSGGPLHMLTKLKGFGFKEAVEYGASWAGLSNIRQKKTLPPSTLSSPQKETRPDLYTENKAKIDKAQAMWNKGLLIQGSVAERYLREHRKIEGPLPDDLRYLPSFMDRGSQKSFPCLMAGARSQSGEITAVQITYLNSDTALKADIPVAKRSFGVVKGSTVILQETKESQVLFIAEGLETALSLKSVGVQGAIKASLGLSNIKRLVPESPHTHIIICADHDAPDSPAAKSLEKSVTALKENGLTVTVIKPDKLMHDFNDVLKNKGPQGVREILETHLPKNLLKIVLHQREVSPQPPTLEENAYDKKTLEKRMTLPPQKTEEKITPLDQGPLGQECPKEKPIESNGMAVFEELTKQCLQKLYAYLGEEKRHLTPDLIKRVESQAEKAANFIFHAHTLQGTQPTEKETKHSLLRAKYELDRVSEIRQELIHKWQKAGGYKGEKDELIAHMIAERQASIEGRMYLERGLTPLPIIPDLAAKELKANQAATKTFAQELVKKHSLSENAATNCAKDILRFQETHGEKPSSSQMAAMVQISRELDKQAYSPSISSHNIEYLRRRDGDLQFRELAAQGKDLSRFRDFPHKEQSYSQTQVHVKVAEKSQSTSAIKENEKVYEMEFSL